MTNSNKLADALRMVTMLRQLGGMLPASREVMMVAVRAADEALDDYDKALAANPAPAADHADYVLVPRVPSNEMLDAAGTMNNYDIDAGGRADDDHIAWWEAMLAAAPQPAPCPCNESTCTESWEPGCGLGNSREHAQPAPAPVQVVGVAELGAKGFTIARFKEADVPLGTKLYTAHPPAPAADGAGELPPLPESVGVYNERQMRDYARAAIAALRQPVPDAVHAAVVRLKDKTFPAHECPAESAAVWNVALYELESALTSQQESRNG